MLPTNETAKSLRTVEVVLRSYECADGGLVTVFISRHGR